MSKKTRFSRSARLCAVAAVLLSVSLLLTLFGSAVPDKFSRPVFFIALYGVPVLLLAALLGERGAHRRALDRKAARAPAVLLWLLAGVFFYKYVREALTAALARVPAVTGLLTAVFGFSFLLWGVTVWYAVRDREVTSLRLPERLAVVVGALYALFRLVHFETVYGFLKIGGAARGVLTSDNLLNVLCLVQYAVDALVFILVFLRYRALAASESEARPAVARPAVQDVWRADGVGIDTLDDTRLG